MTTTTLPAAGELLTRAAVQLRAEDEGAREFSAIGVPYGQAVETAYWREEWAPGSVQAGESALIFANHDHLRHGLPIGRVLHGEDTAEGYRIRARLSDTTDGRDAYQLLRDGVLTSLSIGFTLHDYEVREDDDGEDTLLVTRATAREFSLVPFPAYEGATVTEVRRANHHEKGPTMPPETLTRSAVDDAVAQALNPVQEELATLTRSVSLLGTGAGEDTDSLAGRAGQYRSMGEYLQAAARGDENALELHRAAATGSTTADMPAPEQGSNFLGTQIKFVQDRRKIMSMFSTGPLPAKGNTVEWAQLDESASSFVVGKQAAELDALPGPSFVRFKRDQAPVETYGGWTRLSRQLIERSEVPYLDTVLTGMTRQYIRETNAAVGTVVWSTVDGITAGTDTDRYLTIPHDDPANATVADWASVLVDSGDYFDDLGLLSKGLAVSTDIFKTLATMTASDGRPLMNLTGTGVNIAGQFNLQNGDGELLRIPVTRIPKVPGQPAATGRAFFWDPSAIVARESNGAPILLQDDDVIILGREFSLYGYLAVTVPAPEGILPVTFSTPATTTA